MDRVALVSATFLSMLLALNGSLQTPKVAARKGHNPKLGALLGALVGFGGGMSVAITLLSFVSPQAIVGALGAFGGGLAALVFLWYALPDRDPARSVLPEGEDLKRNIQARHIRGKITRWMLIASIDVALIALGTLLWNIADKSIGLTAVQYEVEPEALMIGDTPSNRPLDELSKDELEIALVTNARKARLRVFILEEVVGAPKDDWATLSPKPVNVVLKGEEYPAELADIPFNKLDSAQAGDLLKRNLERDGLEALVFDEIINPEVVKGWSLWESLTDRDGIEAQIAEKYPEAKLEWRSWVNWEFLTSPLDPRKPDATGLRPALIGSTMIILITIAAAFPVGVGAAIYLEEYAADNRLNRLIQTNISNLAGVPSIIYGMLGLAIFVRVLGTFSSGNAFGTDTANGRTILSAGFTLALLILPVIIVNAQEAIRAVPHSLRQASYGLGATQWQTIWHHVLPHAMPGILTGTILAISRAIGETAPLILVGAATYITTDPEGPFSNFTALPMVIYRWTTYPQAEFRNAAAAAIVVLLVLLLTLNSVAIVLRNRFSRRYA